MFILSPSAPPVPRKLSGNRAPPAAALPGPVLTAGMPRGLAQPPKLISGGRPECPLARLDLDLTASVLTKHTPATEASPGRPAPSLHPQEPKQGVGAGSRGTISVSLKGTPLGGGTQGKQTRQADSRAKESTGKKNLIKDTFVLLTRTHQTMAKGPT